MSMPNLPALRRRIERRMTGSVNFSHYVTQTDPATGRTTSVQVVDLGPVKALIRPDAANAIVLTSPTQVVVQMFFDIWVPYATIIPTTATNLVPASTGGGQPGLVGTKMSILDRSLDDWPIALRLRCRAT